MKTTYIFRKLLLEALKSVFINYTVNFNQYIEYSH